MPDLFLGLGGKDEHRHRSDYAFLDQDGTYLVPELLDGVQVSDLFRGGLHSLAHAPGKLPLVPFLKPVGATRVIRASPHAQAVQPELEWSVDLYERKIIVK